MDQIPESPPKEQKLSIRSQLLDFFGTLAVFGIIGLIIYLFVAQPNRVSGTSMFPNFHDGDYIITNKIGYDFTAPQRGQVIVFKDPNDLSEDFIKRIIGLPGDRVKISNGHVYVNDKELNESYLKPSIVTLPGPFIEEDQEIQVPPDHYFVMGDNRGASSDSREWGFITRQEIIGQALFRYWPVNAVGIVPSVNYSN